MFWSRGSHAGPVRCYCLSRGEAQARDGGAWLTYHPFSWGAFPSAVISLGWPWGFIMGVSGPPPLPHDIMFCPNL